MTTYNNTDDQFGSYIKITPTSGQTSFSYATLNLNSSVSDQDQILVVRKFTPSDDFTAAATPNGLGGVALKGDETWDTWTLPNASTSGSSMYTIDTVAKTITMSSSSSDYVYSRTNSDGSTTDINLPIFSSSDTIYILRKTYITQPFVTWQSGSRFTSSQLNHEVKQLLNTSQEFLNRFDNFGDLNPYIGRADGICPLNSSGTIDNKYINVASVNTLLDGRSILSGDGLTGGGALSSDRTLSILLDGTTALSVSSNGLSMSVDTDLFTIAGSLNLKLNGSSLTKDADGLKVNVNNTLTSDSTELPLSAAQGKALKTSIDLLGSGVRYLGSLELASTAEATITFTDKPNETTTITLVDSDGTSVVFEVDNENNGVTGGNIALNGIAGAGGGATGTAADLTAKVNAQGSLDIEATNPSAGVIKLRQLTGGTAGNTSISYSDSSNWGSSTSGTLPTAFEGGAAGTSFPASPASGGSYLVGDTYDIIRNSTSPTLQGTVTNSNGTKHQVNIGDDIRYNSSTVWYIIPETVTLALTDFLRVDGTRAMTGALDLNSNSIFNLSTPVNSNDAATKNYVDTSTSRTLNLLSDVSVGSPSAGDLLKYSGSTWEGASLAIGDLSNVTLTSLAENQILKWNGSAFVNDGNIGNPQRYAFTGTGSQTAFTMSPAASSTEVNTFIVSIDGILQTPATDYVITNVDTITFNAAPPNQAQIHVLNFGINRSVDSLGTNVVNTSQISDNAVTLAKIASGSAGSIFMWDASGNPSELLNDGIVGQVLTSNGSTSVPSYEYASGTYGDKIIDYASRVVPSTNRNYIHTFNKGFTAKFNDGTWKRWGLQGNGSGTGMQQVTTFTWQNEVTNRGAEDGENHICVFPPSTIPMSSNFLYNCKSSTKNGSQITIAKPIKKYYVEGHAEFIIDNNDDVFFKGYSNITSNTSDFLSTIRGTIASDADHSTSKYNTYQWIKYDSTNHSALNNVNIADIRFSNYIRLGAHVDTTNMASILLKDTSGSVYAAGSNRVNQLGISSTGFKSTFEKVWNHAEAPGAATEFSTHQFTAGLGGFSSTDDYLKDSVGLSFILSASEDLYYAGPNTRVTPALASVFTKLTIGASDTNVKAYGVSDPFETRCGNTTHYLAADNTTVDAELAFDNNQNPVWMAAIASPAGSSLRYLYTWGFNEFGQLGNGTNGAGSQTPTRVSQMTSPAGATLSVNDVKDIYICGNGVYGSLFFTERQGGSSDDLLYACGYNGGSMGLLGVNSDSRNVNTPTAVMLEGEQGGTSNRKIINIWSSILGEFTSNGETNVNHRSTCNFVWILAEDSTGARHIYSRGGNVHSAFASASGGGFVNNHNENHGVLGSALGTNTPELITEHSRDGARGFLRMHWEPPTTSNDIVENSFMVSANPQYGLEENQRPQLNNMYAASPTILWTIGNGTAYGVGNGNFNMLGDLQGTGYTYPGDIDRNRYLGGRSFDGVADELSNHPHGFMGGTLFWTNKQRSIPCQIHF